VALEQIKPIVEALVLGLLNMEGGKVQVLSGKKVRSELRCLRRKEVLRGS